MINKFNRLLIPFLIIFLLSTNYCLGEEGVKELLERGKKLYKEGKFEEAITEWKEILTLTPPADGYHRRAKNLIERAQKEKTKEEREEAERTRKEEEEALLLEIEEAWLPPKRPEKKEVEVKAEVPEVKREVEERAKGLVTVSFEDMHLRDVLNYLTNESGVNIVLDENIFPAGDELELEGVSPRVTIHLKDIPLIEALEVIVRTKGLKYRLEKTLIWITTADILEKEEMGSRTFSLRAGAGDLKRVLEEAIPWPEGSDLRVDIQRGNVIAHNTPTNLKLIEDVIRALDIPPTQILIEAKIVEIFVDSVSELALGLDIDDGMPKNVTEDLSINDADIDFARHVDRWLGDLNTFAGQGISLTYTHMDPERFSIAVTALEKEGKATILSTPSVIALNNEEAMIRITRDIHYPDTFEIEEKTYETTYGDQKITYHRDWIEVTVDEQDVGITLTVTPSVGADMKVITLTLRPELVQKIGDELFIPYPWTLYTPVFFRRTIQSRLMVGDGESVFLGGLVREEMQKDETKVPLLGDIPFLGRLFRRDTTTTLKRNLVVLITCHILTPSGERLRG